MQQQQVERAEVNGAMPPEAVRPLVEYGKVYSDAEVFSASEVSQILRKLYRTDVVGGSVGCDLATVAYFGRDSDIGPLALLPSDIQFDSARLLARKWSRRMKAMANYVVQGYLPRDPSRPFCFDSKINDVATEMLALSVEAKARIDAKMARADDLALSLICLEFKNARGGSPRLATSLPPSLPLPLAASSRTR